MLVFKKVCKDLSEHGIFMFNLFFDLIEYTISQVHGFNFLIKAHFCIDLCTDGAFMTENLADGRKVCSRTDGKGCHGVTAAMIGDVLAFDSSLFCYSTDILYYAVRLLHQLEYEVITSIFWTWREKRKCHLVEWNGHPSLGLLLKEVYA